MAIGINQINLQQAKLDHIRSELNGYYTGADLDRRVAETYANFLAVNANPLHFQFMEESRVNDNTFRVESWLGWCLRGGNPSGSILIKD